MMQSWLAPPIALVLWVLLRAGIYTRGWFFSCMVGLTCVYGLRSFVSIIYQRLHTLRHVAGIVNAKSGTREDKDRRNGFLCSKTTSLVLDLFAVFFNLVLLPASYLLFGSTFNSWQFAIHGFIYGVISVTTFTLTCVHMHSKFNKLRNKEKREARKNAKVRPSVAVSKGKSLASGLSVVEQSDFMTYS
jgi:hypothetical protein